MTLEEPTETAAGSSPAAREPYHSPSLQTLGSLVELTEFGEPGSTFDGIGYSS